MAGLSDFWQRSQRFRSRVSRRQRRRAFQRLEDRRVLATILWDGDAGTPDWFTAANWSGNQVPTRGDDVIISGKSVVQIGRDVSVDSLRIEQDAAVLLGVDGTESDLISTLDGQLIVEGSFTGRRSVQLAGNVLVTETGSLHAAAYSSDTKNYLFPGNSHIRVDGDLVNQGTVQLVSGDIDFRHPCCGGARAEIEIADGSTLVNQGTVDIDFPTHGLRLNDIAYTIDGDVVNEGVVELGFHLDSSDHTFINRGAVRITEYESNEIVYDAIWNVEDAVLQQNGGVIVGDGRATLTDSQVRLVENWTIDVDSPSLSMIRTDIVPEGQSTAELSIAEGRGQLFFQSQIGVPVQLDGTLSIRGEVNLLAGITTSTTSTISLSPYGRLYNSNPQQGDAFLKVYGDWSNDGSIVYRGNETNGNVGDELSIETLEGRLTNRGTIEMQEPTIDRNHLYRIVGNWENVGTLTLNYDATLTLATDASLGGSIVLGSYIGNEVETKARLSLNEGVYSYDGAEITGESTVEILDATLLLQQPLTYDAGDFLLRLEDAEIGGESTFQVAPETYLFLFSTYIAAPFELYGTARFRGVSRIGDSFNIATGGLLDLYGFRDRFYNMPRTHGNSTVTVDGGFVNEGDIRIWSYQGFNPGNPANSGSRSWLTITSGTLINQGKIYTQAPVASDQQTDFRLTGSVLNEGLIEVDGRSLRFESLENAGELSVGHDTSLIINESIEQTAGVSRLEGGEITFTIYATKELNLRGGKLTGDGIVRGGLDVENAIVAPGDDGEAGLLHITNDISITPASRIEIDVIGTNDGQYDRITSASSIAMAGTLAIDTSGGQEIPIGTQIVPLSFSTGGANGFPQFESTFTETHVRWEPNYESNRTVLESLELDTEYLADFARRQWNSGVQSLSDSVAGWLDQIDASIDLVPGVDGSLTTLANARDAMSNWSDTHLQTISTPQQPWTDFEPLRNAIEAMGHAGVSVYGDQGIDGDLLRVNVLESFSSLLGSMGLAGGLVNALQGLATTANLSGTLDIDLILDLDWVLGVDLSGFYLQADEVIDLGVTAEASQGLSGEATLAGDSKLVFLPSSRFDFSGDYAITTDDANARQRSHQIAAAAFNLDASSSSTVTLAGHLEWDNIQTQYVVTDRWTIDQTDSSITVNSELADLSIDDFASGVVESLQIAVDQFLPQEWTDRLSNVALPLLRDQTPIASSEDGLQQPAWWQSSIDALSDIFNLGANNAVRGIVGTAGDELIHASDLRSRTGATGTGVRIGVITRGLGDIDAATRSGDLPGPPDTASTSYPSLQVLNQGDNASGSGLAVLEVLHDVAPEAQLIYHGAETELDYLLAMRAMGDAGIQIVITDVSFPRDPTFSDGPAAAATKDLVDSGVLVIAAAGELGQSQIQQTASPVQVQDRVLHQFQLGDGDAGSVIAVRSRVPGTQQLGLHWRSLGDAIAQDAAAIPRLVKVDYSEVDQHILSIDSDGQIDPIRPYMVSTVDADQAGEVHYFAIELPDASTPFELEIVGSGGLEFVNLPLSLVGGDSISGPAAVPGVVTVGSVDVNTPHMRLPESSRGPSTIDGERRSSLDVMAPTNVRVFGNGQSDFASGTGVAAAHVAAGAALLWDLINRLGRNSAETPAEIRDALRSTASRANDPGNDEGYGLINIDAAASALNLQISDSPFQPIIYSTLERLARQGVIVNVDTDSLRGFLSGESPPVPILQVSVDRQAFDNGTLRGAFEFDLGRDVLGSLGDLSFQGQMEGRLEPAALLQFGFDVGGLYLDSNSWVGGRITLQPQLDAMWHSSEVSLQGEIVAVPRLGFADGSPRVRLSSLSESFANLEVGLLPIENSQPTTLRGSLDVGVTFGFLDYVDADPFTPNSENGGDPFQLKIETGIESDAAAIGFDDLVGAAWDWTEFRLLNPDVDGNGEEDFTTGVFLENIFQFGTDLLQGSGIGDYLRDILGAFGADDLIPFQPRPLGMLPESVPPTPEADSARARIEAGLNSLSGTALQSEVDSALYDWFYGGSSSSSAEGENTGLSILGRLQRLNPFSDDFDSSLNIDGFRESIVEALGDVRRFMSTALTLRGAGDENLIELLGDTAISVARDHMTKALSRAIQQAHDETIRLYHSDAPARRNEQGPGYIDRAVDMYRWSQTAELMGLGGEGTSPAWVLERFPLRVETQFFDFLRPVDVNRLVTIGSETLELRAGLRVKNPGTSINLDPQSADYLSHFSAIDFESGELLVQLQPGEHNRNQIDGQTIGEGFQFLPSLVGQGVFPTSWSPEVTGTVRIPLDDLGTTRTTVRLAESQVNNGVVTVDGDTHLQVTGLVGIDELPLARITSPRMEGKPSIKIKAGLGGLESLTEIGVAIGPGQTATIAAEVWHGNGKVEDAPITFLLIGEGSLGASSSEIKTAAGRTAANGSAFAIYHPPVAETEITSISIAAIYFLAGRSYTKSIDLPLVTTADDFRLLGDYLTPAQFAVEQSDAAAFLAAQQQALLEASEGEVNQEVRDGLQPFVDTWISQGINPALHQANVAKENYDAAVNHPGTSAMQRWQLYREAHQTTQLAATEILDLWANVALLDLEIEEPQSESIALGLRRILAASIQRGIDQFQFGVPATATTNQIDPATGSARPVPAGTPLFDAMQFANAAELLEPYSESLAQELANEQPLLRFQQIVEQAGLLSPTENAPKLVGDFSELSLSGTLGLSSTGVDLLSSGPSVLPMTIEILIDDGHRRETRTHTVNGRVVAGATANDTALLFDLPTGAIEPHQNSTHVRVELRYSIGPVDLLTQHLERYAPVSLSLTGHPATSSSSDETLTLGAASEATLHLSLRRKDSALAGETIDVRLLGGGSLSETRVQLDQNGKAQLSFTAPRFLSVNPDQPFGTTFIVASYWDEQALTTKQLRIDYELIPNLETPFDPEEYYSRDHQRASEQLAAATKSNWRLDPPTNSWDLDMTAVRTEARVILENWFTKSVDDEPSGSDPFGSVLYWLEQARDEEVDTTWTETASGQAFIRRNDEAFRESYERAVQNFDAWRTAVLGFGLDPTELVNVDQATALLKELLEKGISHQQQRARERANEYKALSSAPQTVKNEKLFQLIREGTASLEYTMEGFHRTFWDINGGQGILDELPFYIAFDPTEAANSLDFGSSLTEASLEITPRLYIREEPGQEQGEPVGLALSGMPVSVAPLDGTEVTKGIGVTESDGVYRDTVTIGPGQEKVRLLVNSGLVFMGQAASPAFGIRKLPELGAITFGHTELSLAPPEQIVLKAGPESAGLGGLSTNPLATRAGDRVLVEVQLLRGNEPQVGQSVHISTIGAAQDQHQTLTTQTDGTVRLSLELPDADLGAIQVRVRFQRGKDTIVRELLVPYDSQLDDLDSAGPIILPAQRFAESEIAAALGTVSVEELETTGALPDGLRLQLRDAMVKWLESRSDEGDAQGLLELIEAADRNNLLTTIQAYEAWVSWVQRLQLSDLLSQQDSQSPAFGLADQLAMKVRTGIDGILADAFAGAVPDADLGRQALLISAKASIAGVDRPSSQPDSDDYSPSLIQARLGLELKFNTVEIKGSDEAATLLVQVGAVMHSEDSSESDPVPAKFTAPVNVQVVGHGAGVKQATTTENGGGTSGGGTNGMWYAAETVLYNGATDADFTIMALDYDLGAFLSTSQQKVRLSTTTRIEPAGTIEGTGKRVVGDSFEISSHTDSRQVLVLEPGILRGKAYQSDPPVAAITDDPNLTIERIDGSNILRVSAAPGTDGEATITLATLIAGERVETTVTLEYSNRLVGSGEFVGIEQQADGGFLQHPGIFDALNTLALPLSSGNVGLGHVLGWDSITMPWQSLSTGLFDVVQSIDLQDITGWLQNGLPSEPFDLIQFKLDFDELELIRDPLTLGASVGTTGGGLLPEGLSGSLTIDEVHLGGQLVFGVDTSTSPFYVVTRSQDESVPESTELTAGISVGASLSSDQPWLGGLLNLGRIEGSFSSRVGIDLSATGGSDGRLRLEEVGTLAGAIASFVDQPLYDLQFQMSGGLTVPGFENEQGDALGSINLIGAAYTTAEPASGPLPPLAFELRTGNDFRLADVDPQLVERLKNGDAFSPDDAFEAGDSWEEIIAMSSENPSPEDLGVLDDLRIVEGSLRDAADWYRFDLVEAGNATSFVQVDLDTKRGNVRVELYRLIEGGEPALDRVHRRSSSDINAVRLSLMGQTPGTYFVKVMADGEQLNPRYALSVKPPAGLEDGLTANLAGLQLRNGAFAIELRPDLSFRSELAGRLGFPDPAGDGVLFDVGLHAKLGPDGDEPLVLDAKVSLTIGGQGTSIWYTPAPLAAEVEVELDANRGGFIVFGYKSPSDYKFAGLDVANDRWVIGESVLDSEGAPTQMVHNTSAASGLSGQAPIRLSYQNGIALLSSRDESGWVDRGQHLFGGTLGDGFVGLLTGNDRSTFVDFAVKPINPDTGVAGANIVETFRGSPDNGWRTEQGAWEWTDQGYSGVPSSYRLGDWIEVYAGRLDAGLRIDFNDLSPILDPESITASFSLDGVDAVLFPSDDGSGTPLDAMLADSPRGLAVFSGGSLSANQSGVQLAVDEVKGTLLDLVDVSLANVTLDLSSDFSEPLLSTGSVGLTVPLLSEEDTFVTISAPSNGPLIALTKPNLFDQDASNDVPSMAFLQDGVSVTLNTGLLTQRMDLSGLLPLEVDELELVFHDPRNSLLDASIRVDASLDLDSLSGLPFTPVLAVGGDAADGCADEDRVTLPGGELLCGNGRLSGTLYPAALLSDNPAMAIEQLGPIYLGINDWRIMDNLDGEPLTVGGYLKLGSFDRGHFDGELSGTLELVYGDKENPQASASLEARGRLTRQITESGTITRAEIDWLGEGGGEFSFLAAEGAQIAFTTWIQNIADSSRPFNVTAGGGLTDLSTGEIRIALGPYVELIGAATFNFDAGSHEPFAVLDTAGVEFSDELPDSLNWLSGISFEAGGFGVGRDGTVYVMPNAYFQASADPNLGGNLLGLPSWIPITLNEIGLRFDGQGEDDEPLDVTLQGALTEPGATFAPLLSPENMTLIFSGGLQGSPDGLPLTGRVNKLEVELGNLVQFASNSCYSNLDQIGSESCPLPIEDLAGFTIAIEPFSLAGVEIGGSLGLGVGEIELPDGSLQSAFYGRIGGQFAYGNMGLGAEVIMTQYGPVLARLFSGVPIPIGALVGAAAGSVIPGLGTGIGASVGAQTGFMMTGFEGALIFGDAGGDNSPPENPLDVLTNPEFVAPAQITDDRLRAVMQQTAQRRHDLAQQLNSDDDPDNDINCNAFPPGPNELASCYTWSDGVQLVGSGVLTNINLQNQIGGKVTLGMNLGFDSPGDGGSPLETKVFLRGDLELSGQGVGTAVAVLDFSDREVDGQTVFGPLNPTLTVAAGVPGSGGWLSTLMPVQAQIGATLDTKGIAEASIALVRSLIDSGVDYLDGLLDGLASQLDVKRQAFIEQQIDLLNSPSDSLFAILDVDGDLDAATYNVDLSPAEWNREITGEFLRARLLGGVVDGEAIEGLLPTSINELSIARINVATIIASELLVGLYELVIQVDEAGQFVFAAPPAPDASDGLAFSIYQAALSGTQSSLNSLRAAQQNAISGLPSEAARTAATEALDRTIENATRQAEFAAMLASSLYDTLIAAGSSAADAFFEILDPSLQIRGHIQPVILGIPLGQPRERVFAEVTKESLTIDGSFSVINRLLTLGGIPLPIDDRLTANVYVPFENLYRDLFTYQVPELDLESGQPWQVALSGAAEFAGFQLGQIAGAIFPGGNGDPQLTQDVTELLLGDAGAQTNADGSSRYPGIVSTALPADGIRPDRIYVEQENFDKLVEAGGLLIDGRLTIPRILTEPLTLFNEISDSVWQDYRAFVEADLQDGQSCWDDQAPLMNNVFACLTQNPQAAMDFLGGRLDNFGDVQAVQQVAQMQLFVPNFFTELMDAIGGASAIENLTASELQSRLETAAGDLESDISQLWQQYGYFQGEWGGGLREPGEDATATTDKLLGIPFGGAEISVIGQRLSVAGDYLGVPMQFMIDLGSDRSESFTDSNGNGRWDPAEPPLLIDGQPQFDTQGNQLFVDLNLNGVWETSDEPFEDRNGNGVQDRGVPRAGAEVVFGTAPEGYQVDSRLGGNAGFGRTTTETAALQDLLREIGLVVGETESVPDWLNLSGGAVLRTFSPGFETDVNADALKRTGGIQVAAEMTLASLFSGGFGFEITPGGSDGINFQAEAEIREFLPDVLLPVAPGSDGLQFQISRSDGQLSAALMGSVRLLGAEIPIPTSVPGNVNNNAVTLTPQGIEAEIRLNDVGDLIRDAIQSDGIAMNLPGFELDGDLFLLQLNATATQVNGSLRVEGGELTLPGFELSDATFEITKQGGNLRIQIEQGQLDLGYFVAEEFSGEILIDISNPLIAIIQQFSLDASWSVDVPLTPVPLVGFLDWFSAGRLIGGGDVQIDYRLGASDPIAVSGSFTGSFDPGSIGGDDDVDLFALALDSQGCLRFDGAGASAALPLPGGSCEAYVSDLVTFSITSANSVVEPDDGESISVPAFQVSIDISDLDHLQTNQSLSAEVSYELLGTGTASRGSDFRLPGTDGEPRTGTLVFTFNPKEVVDPILVPINVIGDEDFEDDETIIIRLINPKGGGNLSAALTNSLGVVTIRNDDPPAPIARPSDALIAWSMDELVGGTSTLNLEPTFRADSDRGTPGGGSIGHRDGITGGPGLINDYFDDDGAYVGQPGVAVRRMPPIIGPTSNATSLPASRRQLIIGPVYFIDGTINVFDQTREIASDPRPYFEFYVDGGNPENAVDLTGIDFWARSGDGSELRSWELRTSVDGFRESIASSGVATETADPLQNNFVNYQRDFDWDPVGLLPCSGGMTLRMYYDADAEDDWLMDQLTLRGSLVQSCGTDLTQSIEELQQQIEDLENALPYEVETDQPEPGSQLPPPVIDTYISTSTPTPVHVVDISVKNALSNQSNVSSNGLQIQLNVATPPPNGGSGEGESLEPAPLELRVRGRIALLDLSSLFEVKGRIFLEHPPEQGIIARRFAEDFQLFVAGRETDHLSLTLFEGADERSSVAFAGQLNLAVGGQGWAEGGLIDVGAITSASITGDLNADVRARNGFGQIEVVGSVNSNVFEVGSPGQGRDAVGERLSIEAGDLNADLSINGMLEELQIVGGDLIGDVLASGRIGRVNVQHDSESERGGIASGLIEARSIDSILIVGGDLLSTVRTTDPFHNDLRVVSTPVENRGGRITSRSSLHIAGGVQEIAGTEISLGLHAGGEVQNLTVTPRPDGQRGLLDADLNAHSFGQIRIIDGRLDASINPSAEEWEVTDGVVIDRIELTRTRWIDGGISLPSGTRIGMISSDGVAGHFDGVSDLVLPGFRLQPTIDGLSVTFDVLSTPYYNTVNRYDVNDDGMASPLDALLVINALARGISTQLPVDPPFGETPPFYDTSGDNLISPLDALQVINFLSRNAFTNGEGEYAALYQPLRRKAVNANDSVFQHWDDLEEEVLLKHF